MGRRAKRNTKKANFWYMKKAQNNAQNQNRLLKNAFYKRLKKAQKKDLA